MKLLGIDYGTRRIGLALGDTETSLIFPLLSVFAETVGAAVSAIVAAAEQEGAQKIVAGIPYSLVAREEATETELKVREFIDKLKRATAIPVDTEDERLTTALAERMLREAREKNLQHADPDSIAAAAILETYMSRNL